MGLNVFTRTQFNFAIASKSKTGYTLKRIYKKLYRLTLINGAMLTALESLAILAIKQFNVIEDDELDYWFLRLIVWELIESFLTALSTFLKVSAKSLGSICFVTCLGALDIVAIVMAYVGGITMKKGVVGVYFAFACVTFIKVLILNVFFLFFVDWEDVTKLEFSEDDSHHSEL